MKLSALALVAIALLSVQGARAEEPSAWEAAFPEQTGGVPQQAIHGLGAANEILYGSFFFPVAGKAARDVDLADVEEQLLKRRARHQAVANVRAAQPELAEYMDKEYRAEALELKARKSPLSEVEKLEQAELSAYLKKNEHLGIKAFLDTGREAKETAKMSAEELRKIRGWAPDEEAALKDAKKIKMKYAAGIAVGALLVADGGARLGALLTNREPGFFPAISAARALVKPAAPKPEGERREGAQTSMSVE
jgi:hypothetical protein